MVPVTVTATGASKVELYVDGGLVGTRTAAPWVFSWNSSGMPASVPHGFNGASVRTARLIAVGYAAAGGTGKAELSVIVTPAAGGSADSGGGGGGADAGGGGKADAGGGGKADAGGGGKADAGGGGTTTPTIAFTKPALPLLNVGTLLKVNPVELAGTAANAAKVQLTLGKYPMGCLGTAAPLQTVVASGTATWSYSLDVSALQNYGCYRVDAVAISSTGQSSAPAHVSLTIMNSTTP